MRHWIPLRISPVFVLSAALALSFPFVALGQDGGATEDPQWLGYVLAAIAALVPAAISTFIPSGRTGTLGIIMRIIDALAFNWGKARNDPGSQ